MEIIDLMNFKYVYIYKSMIAMRVIWQTKECLREIIIYYYYLLLLR